MRHSFRETKRSTLTRAGVVIRAAVGAVVAALSFLTAGPARAEAGVSTVKVDIAAGVITERLPFDVPFVIEGTIDGAVPDDLRAVTLFVDGVEMGKWRSKGGKSKSGFLIPVKAIPPNKELKFRFVVEHGLRDDALTLFRGDLELRLRALLSERLAQDVAQRQAFLERAMGACLQLPCAVGTIVVNDGQWRNLASLLDQADVKHQGWIDGLDAIDVSIRLAKRDFLRLQQALALLGDGELAKYPPGLTKFKSMSESEFELLARGEAKFEMPAGYQFVGVGLPPVHADMTSKALVDRIGGIEKTVATLESFSPNVPSSSSIHHPLVELVYRLKIVQSKLQTTAIFRDDRDKIITDMMTKSQGYLATAYTSIQPGPVYSFKARASLYVSMDAGIAVVPAISGSGSIAPYLGINLYLRPVNKDRPLSLDDLCEEPGTDLLRRVSLLVGTTVTSVAKKDRREGLFGNSGLLLGGGARLTTYVRANGGIMVFHGVSPNPLEDSTSLAVAGFVSGSIDVDVASLFGGVSKTVFGL